ncbi:hypothetical protein CW309_28095 [Pseudomonas hunanensis]|uniref:Uncharacterized protein n=1 Tax=Pseudomonas hunanensis TaxID=1247546 RepID=A0ACC9MWC6_9PSED|nr:hypothetical protein CW309_28095 [Pseudomonas hunanensis]
MVLYSWLDAQGSGCSAGVEGCGPFIYSPEAPVAAADHFARPNQVDLAQPRATSGGNRQETLSASVFEADHLKGRRILRDWWGFNRCGLWLRFGGGFGGWCSRLSLRLAHFLQFAVERFKVGFQY